MNNLSHTPKYPVQTLEKALEIIRYLGKNRSSRGFGISEISNKLNIGKSTVHRILDTLLAYGYVEKCNDNTAYRLGWTLFEIGNLVPVQHNLNSIDVKVLEDLCNECGETVNLGIRYGSEVVVTYKAEPDITLKANLQLGGREPIYATSMGKMLLSEVDENQLIQYLEGIKMKPFTPNTITSLDKFIKEIKRIREQGYSLDNEEYCMGLVCIAMPIRNYGNEIVAAVSVSGPSVRLNFNKIMDIKMNLEKTSLMLSKHFGYEVNDEVKIT